MSLQVCFVADCFCTNYQFAVNLICYTKLSNNYLSGNEIYLMLPTGHSPIFMFLHVIGSLILYYSYCNVSTGLRLAVFHVCRIVVIIAIPNDEIADNTNIHQLSVVL